MSLKTRNLLTWMNGRTTKVVKGYRGTATVLLYNGEVQVFYTYDDYDGTKGQVNGIKIPVEDMHKLGWRQYISEEIWRLRKKVMLALSDWG